MKKTLNKLVALIFMVSTALLAGGYHHGEPSPIPEPSTSLLIAGGLIGIAVIARKRGKK